jgi:hypothetical protein
VCIVTATNQATGKPGRILSLTFEQACPIFASCLEVRMKMEPSRRKKFDFDVFDRLPQLLARPYALSHGVKATQCHRIALQSGVLETFEGLPAEQKLAYTLTALNLTICRRDEQVFRRDFMDHIDDLCLDGRYDIDHAPVLIYVAEPAESKESFSFLGWGHKKSPDHKLAELTKDQLQRNILSDGFERMRLSNDIIEAYTSKAAPYVQEIRTRQKNEMTLKNTG